MRRYRITSRTPSPDVIQIILVVLKLIGVIDWSWLVVLIPLWIGIFALCLIVVAMITEYHKSKL